MSFGQVTDNTAGQPYQDPLVREIWRVFGEGRTPDGTGEPYQGDPSLQAILEQEKTQVGGLEEKDGGQVDAFGDTITSGAISGGLNPLGKAASAHAEKYYAAVRKMGNDVKRIAKNTGYTEAQIQKIKNFLFLDEHDLGEGKIATFDPSYEIAQSWQRLIDGKDIKPHDITLLLHEMLESDLMEQGYSQDEAHRIASKKYNYKKGCSEYYGKIEGYS